MDEKIRINKFLSDAGVCSRREADRLAEDERITVNGETASPGMKVSQEDNICIDGKPKRYRKKRSLFFLTSQEGSSAVPDSRGMK